MREIIDQKLEGSPPQRAGREPNYEASFSTGTDVESHRVGMERTMSGKSHDSENTSEKPSVTLPGKVEKIIPGVVSTMPDKAQIAVEGAEDLYKEIRVENTLQDENGKPVSLKPGAQVEVTIEAEKYATEPKNSSDSEPPSDKHPKK